MPVDLKKKKNKNNNILKTIYIFVYFFRFFIFLHFASILNEIRCNYFTKRAQKRDFRVSFRFDWLWSVCGCGRASCLHLAFRWRSLDLSFNGDFSEMRFVHRQYHGHHHRMILAFIFNTSYRWRGHNGWHEIDIGADIEIALQRNQFFKYSIVCLRECCPVSVQTCNITSIANFVNRFMFSLFSCLSLNRMGIIRSNRFAVGSIVSIDTCSIAISHSAWSLCCLVVKICWCRYWSFG